MFRQWVGFGILQGFLLYPIALCPHFFIYFSTILQLWLIPLPRQAVIRDGLRSTSVTVVSQLFNLCDGEAFHPAHPWYLRVSARPITS